MQPDQLDIFASAIEQGNITLAVAVAIAFLVALARVLLRIKYPFFDTDRGAAILALCVGVSSGIVTALAGGSQLSLDVILGALKTALVAMGGYAAVSKTLFMSPDKKR